MTPESAETVALRVLAHIAGDERRLGRFLAATGLTAGELTTRAAEPALLGGVLDYLLADEPLLVGFCAEAGLAPDAPARARAALPGAPPVG